MARNRLTDAAGFRFKDLDLSGSLVAWNDKLPQRVAEHAYLKRDGAEQEPMGAGPGRFTFRCVFIGADWAKRYREVVRSIRTEPRGLLVHPVLGQIQAVCLGVDDAAVNPQQALDTIEFTLSFVEDALDTTLAAELVEGPTAKKTLIDSLSTELTSEAAKFTSSATQIAALVSAAAAYGDAAIDVSLSVATSSTLPGLLGAVTLATNAATAAILADPARTSDGLAFPSLMLAERLNDACGQLDDALGELRPEIIHYTVPGMTSLATLCGLFYGKDATARMDEILALNRIANPGAIPGGAVLVLVAPTV